MINRVNGYNNNFAIESNKKVKRENSKNENIVNNKDTFTSKSINSDNLEIYSKEDINNKYDFIDMDTLINKLYEEIKHNIKMNNSGGVGSTEIHNQLLSDLAKKAYNLGYLGEDATLKDYELHLDTYLSLVTGSMELEIHQAMQEGSNRKKKSLDGNGLRDSATDYFIEELDKSSKDMQEITLNNIFSKDVIMFKCKQNISQNPVFNENMEALSLIFSGK